MIFLREKWAIPTNKKASRILNWEGILSSKICYTEVSKFFNDNNRLGIVKQTLEPSTREKDKAYWNSVKDFRPSIPHWVHSHHLNIKVPPIEMDQNKPEVDDKYEVDDQSLDHN